MANSLQPTPLSCLSYPHHWQAPPLHLAPDRMPWTRRASLSDHEAAPTLALLWPWRLSRQEDIFVTSVFKHVTMIQFVQELLDLHDASRPLTDMYRAK
uniref:Uncharacterized protein n=1 Tax=Aegilops tauschii subsp. strangulata TaxID=200361 RepID=A0A453EPQ1_AEGTS